MTDKLFLAQADVNVIVHNLESKSVVHTKMQTLVWATDEDNARDKVEKNIDDVAFREGYTYNILKLEITPALE